MMLGTKGLSTDEKIKLFLTIHVLALGVSDQKPFQLCAVRALTSKEEENASVAGFSLFSTPFGYHWLYLCGKGG